MRDALLTLFLLVGLPVGLARPFVGAVMFAWLALMNPHRLTWGYAETIPWSMLYALVTLAGLVLHKERDIGASVAQYKLVLLATGWIFITTVFSLVPAAAWERFSGIWKVQLMCLVSLMLLTTRRRIEIFAAVVLLSVIYYGIKGGWFTLLSGGNYRVWGPRGSVIYDNNQLATGLVTALPLLLWLYTMAPRRWMRWSIIGAAVLTLLSVLGSHSRGAFLAMAMITLFLWVKSERRWAYTLLVPPILVAAALFMPDHFWQRIDTIADYETDGSAQGRINVWHTAFRLANDRITGGGLEYYTPSVFAVYAPNPNDVKSSHSIYFQALGEHGWIGLAMFLAILLQFWLTAARISRKARSLAWASAHGVYARMAQVSLLGFATGGLTVNIGNWDFLFYQLVILLAIERLLDRERLAGTGEPAVVPANAVEVFLAQRPARTLPGAG